MRSEMIAEANKLMENRYQLCRMAARVTRCLHFASGSTQEAINDAFARLCTPERPGIGAAAKTVPVDEAAGPEHRPYDL